MPATHKLPARPGHNGDTAGGIRLSDLLKLPPGSWKAQKRLAGGLSERELALAQRELALAQEIEALSAQCFAIQTAVMMLLAKIAAEFPATKSTLTGAMEDAQAFVERLGFAPGSCYEAKVLEVLQQLTVAPCGTPQIEPPGSSGAL
jgi:hypothetical protein